MNDIPNIILSQLGGNRRVSAFLGVDRYIFSDDSLSFRFKAKGKNGINSILVRLDPSDTYTVQFSRSTKNGVKVISEQSYVYCDQLIDLVESITGLYLHF